MLLLILVGILLAFVYLKLRNINQYWEKKGVAYIKPAPFVGNMGPNLQQKKAFQHMLEDFYHAYPNKRYVGIHQFLQPILILRDPDLIKTIAVKDFSSFPDHFTFKSSEDDKVANRMLFNLSAKTSWHEMRSTLTPSFTSSKLKTMFFLMDHCAEQFVRHFERKTGTITLNVKDAYTRCTNDIIASTAFGYDCDSFENPENIFFLMGKELTDFTGLKSLLFFGDSISPLLKKWLKVKTFSEKTIAFFDHVVKETIRMRQEKKITRPDLIQIFMEAKKLDTKHEDNNEVSATGSPVAHESKTYAQPKKQKNEITNDDILAQSLGFYLGGFDTASTILIFLSYELAVNPDIQERLRDEINAAVENNQGKLTYEAVLGMKYLDCVVQETLRLWPSTTLIDRASVTPYTIKAERPDEKDLDLDPGTVCWVPIFAIHRDPQYYPNPEKFDPERFSDENKHNIKPFTFMPFGVGPRNCIGSRFALLETKLIIAKIIQKFDFVPIEKTQIPIQLDKGVVFLPEGGMWLGLKKREDVS